MIFDKQSDIEGRIIATLPLYVFGFSFRKTVLGREVFKEFNLKEVDTCVVRAVYEEVYNEVEIPIKADDDIDKYLGIYMRDLGFDEILINVSQRTGKVLSEESMEYDDIVNIKTIRDLVEKGYSRWLDINFIKFKDSKKIYISAYIKSFDEYADFLEEKTQEIDKYYEKKIK